MKIAVVGGAGAMGSALGAADLAIVFVKCYHTASAVKSAAALIGA